MKWFVVIAFVFFMMGLGLVLRDAVSHARKSANKPIKPAR